MTVDKSPVDAIYQLGIKQGLIQALCISNEIMVNAGSAYDVYKAIRYEIEVLNNEEE